MVPRTAQCAVRGRVTDVVYLGTSTSYTVKTSGGSEVSVYQQNMASAPGTEVAADQVGWLSWLPEHSYVLSQAVEPKEGSAL